MHLCDHILGCMLRILIESGLKNNHNVPPCIMAYIHSLQCDNLVPIIIRMGLLMNVKLHVASKVKCCSDIHLLMKELDFLSWESLCAML